MICKERMSIRLSEEEREILKEGCEATGLLPATFIRYLLSLYGKEKLKRKISKEYAIKNKTKSKK